MIPKIGKDHGQQEDREGDVGFRGAGALGKRPDRQKSHDQPEQGWRGFFAWMTPRRPNRAVPMRLDRSNEG
jgi:hypothetical protein